jgi:hypothetical protein
VGKARPARKADYLAAICEPIVLNVDRGHLHGLLEGSFTFFFSCALHNSRFRGECWARVYSATAPNVQMGPFRLRKCVWYCDLRTLLQNS